MILAYLLTTKSHRMFAAEKFVTSCSISFFSRLKDVSVIQFPLNASACDFLLHLAYSGFVQLG